MPFGVITREDLSDSPTGNACDACPLDAPVDQSDSNTRVYTYAFTVNVSPKKIFQSRMQWRSYNKDFQRSLIDTIVKNALKLIGKNEDDYRVEYELTKIFMVHAHGMFNATEEQAKVVQMHIHKFFGFPKCDPSVCCKIVKTLYNAEAWKRYMIKDQQYHLQNAFL